MKKLFFNLIFFLPELYLIFFLFILFIFLTYYSTKKIKNYSINLLNIIIYISFLIIINTFLIYFNLINWNFIIFNYSFFSNNLIVFLKLLLLLLFFFFIIYYFYYVKLKKIYYFEFFFLIFVSFLALLLLLSANNFLTFFILIEIYNLSIYSAIALRKNSNYSLESGIKYYIFGAISSGILLFSISIFYFFTGCINFIDLNLFLNTVSSNIYLLPIFLFIISFFIKLGIAPFHFWTIDVYDGAPLLLTFYLFIFPKLTFLVILINFCFNFFSLFHYFFSILIYFCIILSAFFGIFGALQQIKFKKLYIFSALFNLSFILVPLLFNTIDTYIYFFYYILIYIFNLVGLFFILLIFSNWTNYSNIKNISFLTFLFKINPSLAIIFSTFLCSLAGLPPFSGFFAKFYIFLNLLNNNFIYLFIYLFILSLIAIFYYLRLIKLIFFNKIYNIKFFLNKIEPTIAYIISFFFIFNLLFIFFSKFFLFYLYLLFYYI